MRNVIIFVVCFAIGAVAALIGRASVHQPYAAPAPAAPAAPAQLPDPGPLATEPAVVNTICPVCGMDVDPETAVQVWQGHRIGLGCAACPAKFAAHADYYGPYALRNEKAPKP